MKILDFTNWNLMLTEVIKRNETNKKYYNTPVKDRNKLEKIDTLRPRCDTFELNELDLAIAELSTPIKEPESGLFSPSLTLATIKDQRLKDYLHYVAVENSRSALMSASASKDPRHTILVPIFLAAHKQYNGINYEDWDKSDNYMKFCVGHKLYTSIEKFRDMPLNDELRRIVRINALMTKTGKPVSPTAYPRGNVKLDNTDKLAPAEPFRHIWLQTWVANVELRNEFMILDVHDWDLVPEALDAVFKPEMPEVPIYVEKEENVTPW